MTLIPSAFGGTISNLALRILFYYIKMEFKFYLHLFTGSKEISNQINLSLSPKEKELKPRVKIFNGFSIVFVWV